MLPSSRYFLSGPTASGAVRGVIFGTSASTKGHANFPKSKSVVCHGCHISLSIANAVASRTRPRNCSHMSATQTRKRQGAPMASNRRKCRSPTPPAWMHKPVFSCSLSAMHIRTCDTTARLSIRSRKEVNTRLIKEKTCSLGVPVSRLIPTSCAWLHDATGRMFSRRQRSPPNPDLEDVTSS